MGIIKTGSFVPEALCTGVHPLHPLSSPDRQTLGSLSSALSQLTLLNKVAHPPSDNGFTK